MSQCGLLTVYQEIVRRVLMTGMKILREKKPVDLLKGIKPDPTYRITRGNQKEVHQPTEGFYQSRGWKNMFLTYYKKLPSHLRETDIWGRREKIELKEWTIKYVKQFPKRQADLIEDRREVPGRR